MKQKLLHDSLTMRETWVEKGRQLLVEISKADVQGKSKEQGCSVAGM